MPSHYLSEDLARFGDIGKTDPARFDLFLKWYQAVMEPGALDGKTKQLIAYAVANAIQEPYCIDSYASACTDAGITPEELAEALQVAAVIRGGGTIAHWSHTLNTLTRKGQVGRRLVVVGYRPDLSFLSELALEISPATEGAAGLSRALANVTDCLSVPAVSDRKSDWDAESRRGCRRGPPSGECLAEAWRLKRGTGFWGCRSVGERFGPDPTVRT